MRIPDPRPVEQSEWAHVMGWIASLEKLAAILRSRPAPRPKSSAAKAMDGPPSLLETIENAVSLGRKIAARLDRGPAGIYERRPRDVQFFEDLVFAVKLDFFQCMDDSDEGFPI